MERGPHSWSQGVLRYARRHFFKMAHEWKAMPMTFSSTGGVYLGLPGPVNEEHTLVLHKSLPHCVSEDCRGGPPVSSQRRPVSAPSAFDCWECTVHFRTPHNTALAPRLVHAAINGKSPNLENIFLGNADDAVDLCYIKDVARAITLLQTAEKLQYDVYNIGSGRLTPNRELVEAIKSVVPNFKMGLPPGIHKVELAIFRKSANTPSAPMIVRASKLEKFYMNPFGLTKA